MFDLQQQEIFERYKHPRFSGSIEDATLTAEGVNQSCGDEVTIFLKLNDNIITNARHTCRACAICTASTDFLLEKLEGQPFTRVGEITTDECIESLGIPLSPTRLKCALLPLEALQRYATEK